jgi:hypothetical protein
MYRKYFFSILKHQFRDIRYFAARGQGGVLFKSKFDALKMLGQMLARRYRIQRSRTVPDSEIEKIIILE